MWVVGPVGKDMVLMRPSWYLHVGRWMVLLVPEPQAADQLRGCFPGALAHKGMS